MGFNVGDGLDRAVRLFGRQEATSDGDVGRTWSDVGDRVARFAGALADLGVEPGTQVAIAALNSHRYFEQYYTVPRLGARTVPLNYRLAPPELVFILNHSESKVLLVDDTFTKLAVEARAQLETVEHVVYTGDGPVPESMIGYEDALAAASPAPRADVDENEAMGLFYTGGTTGMPKGVMLTHRNIVTNAYHITMAMGYDHTVTYLHAAPMFHLADGASTFAVTLAGGQHAFIPMFTPAGTLDALTSHRVTHALLVPTMFTLLIQQPDLADRDLSSLVRLLYGASPMPEEVLRRVMELFPCEIGQGYGMTELSPLATVLTPEDHVQAGAADSPPDVRRRLRSCGREVAGVSVRVVDPAGAEVEPGQVGEIVVRGPNVMKGYWKDPEATADVIRDGWMHTGDLAEVDDEGFVFIVDRSKDMIVSGGENVYSVEVENALYTHDAVLEAAVIGIPHETWGEQVHAIVVTKADTGVDADALVADVKTLIAGYKAPRSVDFADELPKSGAGKILKRDLRAPYWEGEDRGVH